MNRGPTPKTFGASVRVAALAPPIVHSGLEAHEGAWPSGFAPTLFARLFVVTMSPRFTQRPFAIQLLFQPSQRFFHGLTFFQSDFRQSRFTPLSNASHPRHKWGTRTLSVPITGAHHSRPAAGCQTRSHRGGTASTAPVVLFEEIRATKGASNCWSTSGIRRIWFTNCCGSRSARSLNRTGL